MARVALPAIPAIWSQGVGLGPLAPLLKRAHFHYVMVSDWHRTPSVGVQYALNDEVEFVAWLGGCVSYIQRQLSHVDRKSGTSISNRS